MENDSPTASLLEGLPIWVNDSNRVWSTLRIARSIPLGRLEWVWSSRGSSIQDTSTSARAVFEISNAEAPTLPYLSEQPHDWYQAPHVYILITILSELEGKRDSSAWLRIRRFVDDCREKAREYIIIFAATNLEVQQHQRILDNLRSEVNLTSRGRERVVVVPPAEIKEEQLPITHLHHSPSHQDLLLRLRECVRDGAQARVNMYAEQVSRSLANVKSPSWYFFKFFALKEGMAFLFAQLGRRDLAIKFYEEIYAVMCESHHRGFARFCDLNAAEAAAAVINPDTVDYRARLIDGSITELDLRTYLFAREVSLLRLDRRYYEMAERGLKFINALARRCGEEAMQGGNYITPVFRDTWTFSACRALAGVLAIAIPTQKESAKAVSVQLSSHRERHTARLIAGFHVNALKALIGLASLVLPGVLSQFPVPNVKPALIEEAKNNSSEKLRKALSSASEAETLYSEIANAAASLYEMGGRERGAAALDGDAGIVRMFNGSYSEAEKLLNAQCQRFVNDNGWDYLHRRQRAQLAKVEQRLGRVQEYLVNCLTMLYMTRSSRLLVRKESLSEEQAKFYADEAEKWAKESLETAKQLPRVMKYRADRLFQVYVLPNNECWQEGDAGTATVRIKSDIPAAIKLDHVVLEFAWTNSLSTDVRRSALREDKTRFGKQEINEGSPRSSWLSSPGSRFGSVAVENSHRLIMENDGSVELEEGVSDIVVTSKEIPYQGCYSVIHAALFLGNLKLVQTAMRTPLSSVVTTKGGPDFKRPSSPGIPISQPDCENGIVRFPLFFSAQRPPSAAVVIDNEASLFLAPSCVQYLTVKLIAGEHGVKKGARLLCNLLNVDKSSFSFTNQFVEFVNGSQNNLDLKDEIEVLDICQLKSVDCDSFDRGEYVLPNDLQAHEVLEARIGVRLLASASDVHTESDEEDFGGLDCVLMLSMSCSELDSSSNREFVDETEANLHFCCPIDIAARIDLNSEWDDGISIGVGLDGTPLSDGGTLVCSIQSKILEQESITLTEATLETPKWLELRPDEPPAHVELLPCLLRSAGVFICAFDVLVREEVTQQFSANSFSDDDVTKGAISRRMSSLKGKVSGISLSSDGMPRLEPRISTESAIGKAVTNISSTEIVNHGEEADLSMDNSSSGDGRADDVVDLSGSGNSNSASADTVVPDGTANSATLHLSFRIAGVEGVGHIERHISMGALRNCKRRFRISRSVSSAGAVGQLIEVGYSVTIVGREYDIDAVVMQYEVDADPTSWIVAGRRRGQLELSQGVAAHATANIIALQAGRLRLPGLRLFSKEGRGLPWSRYENVDECNLVCVVPCGSIVSGCKFSEGRDEEGKAMPVVIASDSFFSQ